MFLSSTHEERFYRFINTYGFQDDIERQSFFYIISGNDILFDNVKHIYDFQENMIIPDCFEKIDLSGGVLKLLKAGFNLYNGYPADIWGTFRSLDTKNEKLLLIAIQLRLSQGCFSFFGYRK